jgi:hypothetical protein
MWMSSTPVFRVDWGGEARITSKWLRLAMALEMAAMVLGVLLSMQKLIGLHPPSSLGNECGFGMPK